MRKRRREHSEKRETQKREGNGAGERRQDSKGAETGNLRREEGKVGRGSRREYSTRKVRKEKGKKAREKG